MNVDKVVELDLLTQTELADKIKNPAGRRCFWWPGGTRDPRTACRHRSCYNVLATHTARSSPARQLGKTIVAPTIPFAVAATGGASAKIQWKAFS